MHLQVNSSNKRRLLTFVLNFVLTHIAVVLIMVFRDGLYIGTCYKNISFLRKRVQVALVKRRFCVMPSWILLCNCTYVPVVQSIDEQQIMLESIYVNDENVKSVKSLLFQIETIDRGRSSASLHDLHWDRRTPLVETRTEHELRCPTCSRSRGRTQQNLHRTGETSSRNSSLSDVFSCV